MVLSVQYTHSHNFVIHLPECTNYCFLCSLLPVCYSMGQLQLAMRQAEAHKMPTSSHWTTALSNLSQQSPPTREIHPESSLTLVMVPSPTQYVLLLLYTYHLLPMPIPIIILTTFHLKINGLYLHKWTGIQIAQCVFRLLYFREYNIVSG